MYLGRGLGLAQPRGIRGLTLWLLSLERGVAVEEDEEPLAVEGCDELRLCRH